MAELNGYIYSEYIKEKREKHIILGLVDVAWICFIYFTNLYKLRKEAGILDIYCDNMQIYFLITLVLAVLYAFVIVADEYQNKTIYQLVVIPINAGKFVAAKIIVVAFVNFVVMFTNTIISTIVMLIMRYNVKFQEVAILVVLNLFDSVLLTMIIIPVICLTILCKGRYLVSLLVSTVYIVSCFMINMLPVSQEFAQKVIAYLHPLGGFALIHNWLIYILVPNEISMIICPKESVGLALIGVLVYALISFMASQKLLNINKGK